MTTPKPAITTSPMTAMPEIRTIVAAVVAAISAIVTALANRYLGDMLLPEIVAAIPVVVGAIVFYFIPMSTAEVANRVTNEAVRIANADMSNPTTAEVVSPLKSDEVARKDIKDGKIPDAIAAKRTDVEP